MNKTETPRHVGPATALDTEFTRGLGLYDSTMVVVGSMIGSGIFLVSADMARTIGSPGWLLVGWAVAGALTIVGALSYGELAAMMPRAGSQYVYIREAFSPLWGFLYGWTLFLVIQSGTVAAVAVGFARYFGVLVPWISDDHYLIAPIHLSTGYALCRSRRRSRRGDDPDCVAPMDQHARPRYGRLIQNASSRRQKAARSSPWCCSALSSDVTTAAVADNFGSFPGTRGRRSTSCSGCRPSPRSACSLPSASRRPGRSSPPTRGTTSRSRPAR